MTHTTQDLLPIFRDVFENDEIEISEYLFGDDCDAVDFWMSEKSEMIGVGSTPDAAVENLYERYREKGGPTRTSLD